MKAEWTNSDSLTTSQTTKAILVIDIPKACADGCPVMCRARGINHRPSWCPLKPIPEGHGDLIDRKALIENGLRKGFCDWYDEIKMADAIIESDKGETE